jgi:hypothetical protein
VQHGIHHVWTVKEMYGVTLAPKTQYVKTDDEGFATFQLHDLMNRYGQYLFNGSPNLPFESNAMFIGEITVQASANFEKITG